MTLQLKNYQERSLAALENFFILTSFSTPDEAFEKCLIKESMDLIPYNDRMEGIPSVCIRIPTGGGKTLLAAHSIPIAAENYANTDAPLVLWLVPTDMIRQQTLKALTDVRHPYRQALQSHYGDRLKVCDLDTLQTMNKHDIGNSCVIVVTTIQTFNINKDKTHQRNAYAFDENLSEHFTNLTVSQEETLDKVTRKTLEHQPFLSEKDIGRVKHSLVNFFNLHRPITIIDEAHKNRDGKSFFNTLQQLNPKCLIELTATPKDNNVLYSVSAAELKTDQMIKLPVILTEHHQGWQSCIIDALIRRAKLELIAQKEAEYIRPILLIQAQDKNGEANIEAVKQFLIEENNISEDWIAISTGSTRELDDVNLFSKSCPIRIVITVEALKEGWDCSFAYILASLQNINSATDVEQLLGRVLRMPYAKERQNIELNKAYAHVISDSTAAATENLKDRMVENMGFNRWEAEAAIVPATQAKLELDESEKNYQKPKDPETLISLPFDINIAELEADLQVCVRKHKTSQGTALIINTGTTDERFNQIQDAALNQATPKQKVHVQSVFQEARAQRQAANAPENWNAKFSLIPQLGLMFDGNWQLADKEAIEDFADWDLLDFPISLKQFQIRETVKSFEIDVNIANETLTYSHIDSRQLHFSDMPTPITETDLVNWLDKRTRRTGLTQTQLRAYLVKLLAHLIHEKKITLTSLHRSQFQLVQAIKEELDRLSHLARKKAFQTDMFDLLMVDKNITEENSFEFKAGIYPVKKPYRGSYKFRKHFYREINDLIEKTEKGRVSEEFICARLLDMHPRVKHWVRNIDQQQKTSFWLPTDRNNFYPDFIAELTDGTIFVLEYKGDHLDKAPDAIVKDDVGRQWAKDSEGKRIFLMATAKDQTGRILEQQIDDALA